MHPLIDTTLTGVKEECHHFLQRINFEIEENKQQFIFHSSETWFPPSTIASLTGFLGDVLLIPIGMIRHLKVYQQLFKLSLIQTCEGTERAGMVFEPLIGEHHCHLCSGVLDLSMVLRSLLYHYSG